MKVSAVKKYMQPEYPTKFAFSAELLKVTPKKWHIAKPLITLALSSSVLAGFSGCYSQVQGAMDFFNDPESVTITEDDAMIVIDQVASEYGVHFARNAAVTIEKENKVKIQINLDGYDEKKNIGYEFMGDDAGQKYFTQEELDRACDYPAKIFGDIYAESKHEYREKLKDQVVEFMEYLKENGLI